MEKRNLLLISGKIFSGKDFTADILVEKYNWKKLSLANELKTLCSKKYNIDVREFYSHYGKSRKYDEKRTNRDLLIETSLEIKKDNMNYFVDILVDKIEKIKESNIVISDFRFPHEYCRFIELLSDKFYIYTCSIIREQGINNMNKSENSLNDFQFNFKILNDKGEERIISQLKSFVL